MLPLTPASLEQRHVHPQAQVDAHPCSGSEALGRTFACPEPPSALPGGACGWEMTVRAPAFLGAQHSLPFLPHNQVP